MNTSDIQDFERPSSSRYGEAGISTSCDMKAVTALRDPPRHWCLTGTYHTPSRLTRRTTISYVKDKGSSASTTVRLTCIPSIPTVKSGIFAHLGPLTPGVPTHWTSCPLVSPPRSYSSPPPPVGRNPPPVISTGTEYSWTDGKSVDPRSPAYSQSPKRRLGGYCTSGCWLPLTTDLQLIEDLPPLTSFDA